MTHKSLKTWLCTGFIIGCGFFSTDGLAGLPSFDLKSPNSLTSFAVKTNLTPSPSAKAQATLSLEERLSFYGAGLGVALATIPLSLKSGAYLGTVSNELVTSLLLPFGAFTLIPATAVVIAQYFFSQQRKIKTRSWVWPLLAGIGIQVAGFATGAMLGINPNNLNELVGFSFVQALILPSVSTLVFGPHLQTNNPSVARSLPMHTSPLTRSSSTASDLSFRVPLVAFHF